MMDGTGDRRNKNRASNPVASIFVHAGAGYHSTTNEQMHLGACNDAAKMGMRMLKAGGSAVDAVEAAIVVLEDKEITNAGFGSNLTIEGNVECDATMVDHLGRSGACGSTGLIKNPIHLARVILEASNRPLSLRRVPPNLLVGEGATGFAYENGIPNLFNDSLVSKNARDRFIRWQDDLQRAGGIHVDPDDSHRGGEIEDDWHAEYNDHQKSKSRGDHTNALMSGTWNEGQPDSPAPRSPVPDPGAFFDCSSTPLSRTPRNLEKEALISPPIRTFQSPVSMPPSAKRQRLNNDSASEAISTYTRTHSLLGQTTNGKSDVKSAMDATIIRHGMRAQVSKLTDGTVSLPSITGTSTLSISKSTPRPTSGERTTVEEDLITDTVGAIAIDVFGNIAAGSSSGGIGMKHKGRVGPAALVGVGTAVVPCDPEDPDEVSVASVTSGTGEHMATSMASQRCADRLYHNTARGRGGRDVVVTEEDAIESFILNDFMGHPGVRNSHSAGAIGVMAVKKTKHGVYLHFAHNTDSFALASMHSNEKEAKCVMSRIGEEKQVVQGGRKIRNG